jgi:hypothetical protein
MAVNAIVKFLNAARSLVNQGMSKEAVMNFAKNEFGEINELFKKQIDNLFKPKQGIENIKLKDEVFDDTVIKLPVDDTGAPFNPKDPMKQYGKPKKDPPTGFQTERFIRDFPVTREEAERIAKLPNDERKIILQKYIDEDMSRQITLMDYDPPKGRKPNAEGGIAGFYTGGIVDVEPSLSDIGHGSDALMARTRLMSPGNQATTSTGLNYLLAEDNDNLRVPFANGNGVADEDAEKAALGKRVRELMDDGFDFGEAVKQAMSEGYAEGGRIGFSKGKAVEKGLNYLMDLFTNKKMFRSKDDVPTSGFSEKTGPITIEDMMNIPEDELRKIRRTQELGLYDETPEILKAGNLFERFTKKVGGERVIDYDRAEFILNKKLKGNETLNDLLQIEYQTRPGRADGGRIGFSKGKLADAARRKFMKTAGAGAAGLAALKTGLLGFGKEAAPVVEKAVETVQQTPQYFFDLVAKIKMFGKQSKVGPQERMNEFSYTGKNGDEYTLVEDISTGDAQITKDKMGGVRVSEDEVTDGIVDRSVMEYKSGKGMADESTKGTLPDEYDEYKVEFDQDGTQAGADILDESVQKEIIEEISTDKFLSDKMKFKEVSEKITKKASGGIARMIGE